MRGTLAALFCGLGVLGCHQVPQAQFPSVESALSRLYEQTDCSRAVQGDASLVASGPLVKVRGKMLYMAEAPEKVRFDLYSEFGVTLSTLTSDGKKFGLYSLDQRSFWHGPARTCNIKRFTQVAVPPFALVELLRGRPPVLEHDAGAARIKYRRPLFSEGRYVVDIESANEASQRLELGIPEEDFQKPLSLQRVRLLSVRVKQGGDLLYKVVLDGHRAASRAASKLTAEEIEMGVTPLPPSGPECNAELPSTLSFTVPGSGYKLTIENERAHHNPPIAPAAFQQSIPPSVRAEYSDCVD
jgi:hypothetical protein